MPDSVLDNLVKRRHPEYERMKPHWDFIEATYQGGRAWFSDNVFRYIKEGDTEYKQRIQRAYRFNHSREVVNLVNKYIFKADVNRIHEDTNEALRDFWHKATREGQSIEQLMRSVDIKSSVFGRVWVMTDSTATHNEKSVAERREAGARVYAYIVRPQNLLDVGYDNMGDPLWVLIFEQNRDDDDPFTSTGAMRDRFRLWTRNEWFLYGLAKDGENDEEHAVELDRGEHNLGVVPGFPVDHIGFSEAPYSSPSLINDIAYLDRAVANYLSNLDAVIQDQTFSQLAMPAQGVMPGDDVYNKLIEMGTKRIFTYDGGDGNNKPFYLSPDPSQAQLIVTVIKMVINEIYHSVGVAGERTKQDNAVGIDNSSGVAKAYDFERVNSLLASKAAVLARTENRLARLVRLWGGDKPSRELDEFEPVDYPTDFDVRGLFDEMEISSKLNLLEAPKTLQQHQMKVLAEKLFPHLPQDIKARMQAEMKTWTPADDEFAGNAGNAPG